MDRHPRRRDFRLGFRAMAPLWLGVVPFGVAFAVVARDAGLSLVETQALSLLVFAGSAQFTAVGLIAAGTGGLSIVLTTLLLNVRHLLYGLSLGRAVVLTPRQRPIAAFFLTDEAYGVSISSGVRTFGFLLGTELSLFFTWNAATLAGAVLGETIPDPTELGIDLVFPLAFVALLVPLIRTRVELLVAALAGGLAWVLAERVSSGVAILATGVAGSLLGAWLTRGQPPPAPPGLADAAREVA